MVILNMGSSYSVVVKHFGVQQWIMELFREVGLDQRVESLAPPMREWREFRYCRSLLGRQIACDDHMATPAWDVLQEASPARLTHVSQPGLEGVLREARILRTIDHPSVIRFIDIFEDEERLFLSAAGVRVAHVAR